MSKILRCERTYPNGLKYNCYKVFKEPGTRFIDITLLPHRLTLEQIVAAFPE